MIEEQLKKSWFGKPYIECGQSLRLCAHLFELGGVLGAKHSEQLDAFALAFLGEIESAKSHCENVARWLRGRRVTESMTFADYVQAAYVRDCHYTGDAATILAKHSKDRMERDIVNGMAKLSTEHGFAVGVEYPHLIRAMFQQTATKQKLWVSWSYEEAEEAKNKDFMRYCEQYRPGVYALLRVNTPVRRIWPGCDFARAPLTASRRCSVSRLSLFSTRRARQNDFWGHLRRGKRHIAKHSNGHCHCYVILPMFCEDNVRQCD